MWDIGLTGYVWLLGAQGHIARRRTEKVETEISLLFICPSQHSFTSQQLVGFQSSIFEFTVLDSANRDRDTLLHAPASKTLKLRAGVSFHCANTTDIEAQEVAEVNRRPASLLVKVLGISFRPFSTGQTASVGLETLGPALLEVGIVGRDNEGCSHSARRRRQVSEAVLQNPFLPIDQIFEVTVPDRSSIVFIRLSRSKLPVEEACIGESKSFGGFEPCEARFPFTDVLRTRTLSVDLQLIGGGEGVQDRAAAPLAVMSVVCSARGLYSLEEWGLLEWLGDCAADLPMLLRCGIRNLQDLETLSLSELLAAMEAGGLAPNVRARIAGKFHASKAAGPGFLGSYGKALGARIHRFYRRPGALSAPPGLGGSSGSTWRGPIEPRWTGNLFEECMVESDP